MTALLYWKQILAGTVLLVVLAFTYWLGGQSGRTELAEYKASVAEMSTTVAELRTEAERKARETEQAHAKALADVATQYEQDKQDAQATADRLVADLRAGNRKLRDHWQGCKAQLPGVSPGASELAGQDRLREEDIGRVLEWAGILQAQRDGLQAVTEADRGK